MGIIVGKLKKGDKVCRFKGYYKNMNIGDTATVKSLCGYNVELEEYGKGHSIFNLKIVKSKFNYGDEVRFTQQDEFKTKGAEGIYIGEHPEGDHIVINKYGMPLHVKTVGERNLDGEVREIDGHKYKLKLVK